MLKALTTQPQKSLIIDGITGRWINDVTNGGSQAGVAGTADTLYAHAYALQFPAIVKTLAVRVTTVGTSSNVKAALYRKRPNSTVCDLITDANPTGLQTSSGTGTRDIEITDITLNDGLYIAATLIDGAAGAVFSGFASASLITAKNGGYTSASNLFSSSLFGFSQSQSYAGGFPATIDLASMTQVTTNIVPQVALGI